MAHEIEGNSVFVVGKEAWHGLGLVLDNPPTVQEAIEYAGLNWDVILEPMYRETLSIDNGLPQKNYVKIESKKVVLRGTDSKELGVVGNQYEPLQNVDAFKWFQPFLDSGLVTLESAGCLCEGRKVWILAKFKDSTIKIKGNDTIEKYILLSNSHDGTTAISAGYTPVRVICHNTLTMAHNDNKSQLLKVRHTIAHKQTLDDIRNIMNLANQTFEATAEQYRRLANQVISSDELDRYVKIVLGQNDNSKEIATRSQNQIDRIKFLFERGKGNDMPEIKHTAWAAYNAVTEYLSHEACNNLDNRYNSLWFGTNKNKSTLALNKALELVH